MSVKLTDFQRKVYAAVSLIPQGKVSTYGLVAAYIGCGSARAVGQALKVNPFAPVVPCHRVVRSDLRLGGFCGSADEKALNQKRALLLSEGVRFVDPDTVHPDCLYTFT